MAEIDFEIDKNALPFKSCENTVVVSAGGMDIKVTGCNVTFTIGQTNWQMSIGELEAMLESHQLLVDACKQLTSSVLLTATLPHESFHGLQILDNFELNNSVKSAKEALSRADAN